jgi:hypothetical protein
MNNTFDTLSTLEVTFAISSCESNKIQGICGEIKILLEGRNQHRDNNEICHSSRYSIYENGRGIET